ncbi:ATP-binding protein [Konateibacter massiliensis]|uniref:ATP-binding protein n=1 Tax=Konateibacter massiliensis TaxID=2002841 RepID=UPI000C15BE12|nr:ATP-binding protein [Konateibacter massiliensis]
MNLFDFINGINPTIDTDVVSGIRLHNLEVYNWGTFDKDVWNFTLNGNTSLLTGDSGAGKSTIVDALTTLLVPPQKIAYNKAADASAKERNTKSYVLGYYGRKYAFEGKGKPEALRESNNYSTILATFKDMIQEETITIAIFFWFKDNESIPSKMYVVSKKELFVTKDFTRFNSSVKTLKENLKKSGAMLFDNYKSYAECYRRLMGNITEQAIELFQQTISMKKVEALNDFVRDSMLEKENTEEQIDKLLKHYHNLNSSYEAVVKAREQIEVLQPINIQGLEHFSKKSKQFELDRARACVDIWFASRKTSMILKKIEITEAELNEVKNNISAEEQRHIQIRKEILETKSSIAQNGGAEIERLSREIEHKKEELISRENELLKYNGWAKNLNLNSATSIEIYNDNVNKIPTLSEKFQEQKSGIQSKLTKSEMEIEKYKGEKENIGKEIGSLRLRSSNIQSNLIDIREKLCHTINVNKELLPFAGELLEVKEKDIKWEGAIERLVHGFALSLLVPEQYYDDVALWVDKQPLGVKLVYYRTGKKSLLSAFAQKNENTVASKLDIKTGTLFTDWITNEVEVRFPHICCETMLEFKRESKAITIKGQIKSNIRHEKDDRSRLDDRARYVLGFSNKKKIEVLRGISNNLEKKLKELQSLNGEIRKEQDRVDLLISTLEHIRQCDDYKKLDVYTTRKMINEYERRILELENSNSILETLRKHLETLEEKERNTKDKENKLREKQGVLKDELVRYRKIEQENQEKLRLETEADRSTYNFLAQNFTGFLGNVHLTLDNAETLEKKYGRELTSQCDSLQNELSSLKSEIEKAMARFRNKYPEESFEMSENVQSIQEYDDLLNRLQYHNLPKYQEDFKQELQGKIIQHISMFNGVLSSYRTNIRNRIKEINESLHSIDYNLGRYITIVCEETPETDIKYFRNQLKACTEGMAAGIEDNDLAEIKFTQIKEVIERFKGRPQFSDIDRRWTNKVTDVRNWFVFSASERWRDSDEEYEHYSDSDGKSGGQKEKLAYTILAASLAYNYRLNRAENDGSSFRLVVIDEAFLKSSDDSAKFGLKLFEQMKFQLLVVTPLLKISTIEPFISHVGFVTYSDITHRSTLKNITMEVYRQKRKEWEGNELVNME